MDKIVDENGEISKEAFFKYKNSTSNVEHKKSIRTNNQLLQSLSSNNVQFVTRFAVETKLLEFNSVMGGSGKQSTVKKYNKVS